MKQGSGRGDREHGVYDQSGLVSSSSRGSLNMITLCPSRPAPFPLIASAVASHFASPLPYMIYRAEFLRLGTLPCVCLESE